MVYYCPTKHKHTHTHTRTHTHSSLYTMSTVYVNALFKNSKPGTDTQLTQDNAHTVREREMERERE